MNMKENNIDIDDLDLTALEFGTDFRDRIYDFIIKKHVQIDGFVLWEVFKKIDEENQAIKETNFDIFLNNLQNSIINNVKNFLQSDNDIDYNLKKEVIRRAISQQDIITFMQFLKENELIQEERAKSLKSAQESLSKNEYAYKYKSVPVNASQQYKVNAEIISRDGIINLNDEKFKPIILQYIKDNIIDRANNFLQSLNYQKIDMDNIVQKVQIKESEEYLLEDEVRDNLSIDNLSVEMQKRRLKNTNVENNTHKNNSPSP